MQRQLRQLADDLGIASELKKVRRSVLPSARRNAIDDKHLTLLMSFVLQEDSSCIDVGAHTGAVLRQMLHYAPRGRHLAFEPIPHLHAGLAAEFPDVDVRCAALSDVSGVSSFAHVVSRPAYSGLRQRVASGTEEVEQLEVKVEVLDETVPPGFTPTLVKIDVEGAEYQVIRGGQRLLAATRPWVVFEFGAPAAAHYGTTPDDMFTLLNDDIGLHIFDMDGTGPYSRAGFRAVYESGKRFNFVAHA